MAITIDNAFVQQFKDNITVLAQQKGSKLEKAVMTRSVTGKFDHWDRIGSVEARKVTSRHDNTPLIPVPHSRRRVTPETYDWADLIDKRDEVRMLIDPKSTYAMQGAYALGRVKDDQILAALTGNSFAIDADDASSTVALPAANIIAKNYQFSGSSDTGMTVEKLIKAREIILGYNVDIDDPMNMMYCAIDAQGQTDLLNDAKYINRDFGMPVLDDVTGSIKSFVGINFIHTERVLDDGSGDKLLPVWCKSAIGMSVGQDITARVSERDDKRYSWQAYAEMDCGATRIEEEKVVAITATRT